jgi:hypothetical protein
MARTPATAMTPVGIEKRVNGLRTRQAREAAHKREEILELRRTGMMVKECLAQTGVSTKAYERYRRTNMAFAQQMDALRRGDDPTPNGSRFDFEYERRVYFDHESPTFQLEVVRALERLRPGNILMVIFPPEHGKTTLFEDWACLRIAHDPSYMIHVGSESQSLSKKILAKVRQRMNPPAGSRLNLFVNDFGPFAPQPNDQRGLSQPWSQTYFDVYRKREFDDRDYSMAAIGFGSQIIGSRSNHLHADDIQSLKTLGQTESMVDTFRQDWLSRPGETGITTVFGNRVDTGDFYESLEDAIDDDILQIIRMPALIVDPDTQTEFPLWPERWDLEKLDRMRRKVGEERWQRNWMQRPLAAGATSFSEEDMRACLDTNYSLERPPERDELVYIGLDPAMKPGRNCVVGVAVGNQSLRLAYLREDVELNNNEQIMSVLNDAIMWLQSGGASVSDVVIESMNFQRGLARDERLQAMRHHWGFTLSEHLTGINKYDPDIGVPSMAASYTQRKVVLPWAEDTKTRTVVEDFIRQHLNWRPMKSGKKLRQDQVMAFWFAWIRWRGRREELPLHPFERRSTINIGGLPYAPTRTGLVVPTRLAPIVATR